MGYDFPYNTGLANSGSIAGKLVVDTGTLITLAKADPSGSQLDLLFRTGRDVVITSTVATEATDPQYADGNTIADWITRNGNRLILDNNPANPPAVPASDNGEISIIGYVNRTGGDIRVVTEDLKWMEGLRPGLPAARDLTGTSGINLTTNEFVNDLLCRRQPCARADAVLRERGGTCGPGAAGFQFVQRQRCRP